MNVGFEPSQVLLREDILKQQRVDALCLLLPHSCRTFCHLPFLALYVSGSFSQYTYYFAPVLPARPHPCSVAEICAGNQGFFPMCPANIAYPKTIWICWNEIAKEKITGAQFKHWWYKSFWCSNSSDLNQTRPDRLWHHLLADQMLQLDNGKTIITGWHDRNSSPSSPREDGTNTQQW